MLHEVCFEEILSSDESGPQTLLPEGARIALLGGKARTMAVTLLMSERPTVISFVEAREDSLSSHIGVELSHRAISETVLGEANPEDSTDYPATLVRNCFKAANRRVYDYSNQMASTGQVSALGFVAVLRGLRLCVGQVGRYESFVWRGTNPASLFDYRDKDGEAERDERGLLRRFIGANAQVLVDIASATLRAGDIVVLSALKDRPAFSECLSAMGREEAALGALAKKIAEDAFRLGTEREGRESYHQRQRSAVFLIRVSEDAEKCGD